MWWLLKLLIVGPPSKIVQATLRRTIEDLRDDVARWEQKQAALAGNLLTQTRRITRLERELPDADDDEAEDGDEFNKLLEEKRRQRG